VTKPKPFLNGTNGHAKAQRWADHQRRRPIRKCAVCYLPPEFRRLPREQRLAKRGDIQSNWICRRCRSEWENYRWKAAPREERDLELDPDSHLAGDSIELTCNAGPYEGERAIAVMKLYCSTEWTQGQIAASVGCTQQYVSLVITHWKAERPWFVEMLREALLNRTRPV
jgi:hypothetical protein